MLRYFTFGLNSLGNLYDIGAKLVHENMQDKYEANLILNVMPCCFSPHPAFTWKFVTEDCNQYFHNFNQRSFSLIVIQLQNMDLVRWATFDAWTLRLFSDHRLSKIIFG